jgi:hypothetical protein
MSLLAEALKMQNYRASCRSRHPRGNGDPVFVKAWVSLDSRIWSPPYLQGLITKNDRDRIAAVYPASL